MLCLCVHVCIFLLSYSFFAVFPPLGALYYYAHHMGYGMCLRPIEHHGGMRVSIHYEMPKSQTCI